MVKAVVKSAGQLIKLEHGPRQSLSTSSNSPIPCITVDCSVGTSKTTEPSCIINNH